MHTGFDEPIIPPQLPLIERVRATRNGLLAASDWTQLPDSPLTGELMTEWTTYRQELRDITEPEPESMVDLFPEPPAQTG